MNKCVREREGETRRKKRTPTRNWICHTIVDETIKQKRRETKN
jgi:hypothetical protein